MLQQPNIFKTLLLSWFTMKTKEGTSWSFHRSIKFSAISFYDVYAHKFKWKTQSEGKKLRFSTASATLFINIGHDVKYKKNKRASEQKGNSKWILIYFFTPLKVTTGGRFLFILYGSHVITTISSNFLFFVLQHTTTQDILNPSFFRSFFILHFLLIYVRNASNSHKCPPINTFLESITMR